MPPMPGPACPRCGYDQTGVTDAWAEICPLRGVCSECGLEFWWADVLNPALTTPAWSFEHTQARFVRRLLMTALVALAPWRLWRRIRLEHPIHVRRLATVIIACAAMAHLLYGAVYAGLVYNASVVAQVSFAGLAPRREPWQEAIRALIWPYADIYFGVGWRGTQTRSLISTADYAAMMILAATALALLLLPESFSRARIRRAHALRGAAMSFVVIVPLTAAWLIAMWLIGLVGRRSAVPVSALQAQAAVAAAGLIWLWIYWRMFVTRYLRLQHGAIVATSMIVIGLLSVTTLLVLARGPEMYRWLSDVLWRLTRGY